MKTSSTVQKRRTTTVVSALTLLAASVLLVWSPGRGSDAQQDRQLVRTGSTNASNGRRVALVIGNGAYPNAPLKNPVNDAHDIAAALGSLGFEVISRENANQNDMKRAIREFGEKIRGAAVGLFYYAGHGVQVNGENFLVPVDAKVESEQEVEYECVKAGFVLAQMDAVRNTMNIVILDACRNNPFARSFRSETKRPGANGCAVGYAHRLCHRARLSRFGRRRTKRLVHAGVAQTNADSRLAIEDVFKRVRISVRAATQQKQTPWESSSLVGDFYFSTSTAAKAELPLSNSSGNTASAPVSTAKTSASLPKSFKNQQGIEMVYIPPGSFDMGSNNGSADEKPVHRVTIAEPFYMGKYEVTQAEWQAVMGNNPSYFKGDNLPVEYVSWNDVQQFIGKLNEVNDGYKYRLPTEAEWEYVCRAGTTTEFSFGSLLSSDQANFNGNYSYGGAAKGAYREKTTSVGSFAPNALGLFDMHGNVWEWCEDWYHDSYAEAPTDGGAWLSGGEHTRRVLRGGSWGNYASNLRSAVRNRYSADGRDYYFGFRVVAVVRTQ